MLPPIGDSLTSRVIVVLLAGVVAFSLLLAAAVIAPSPREVGGSLFQLPVPAETQAIVEALEATPPAARPLVVKAFNSSITASRLEPDFPPIPPGLRRDPALERKFIDYDRQLGGRDMRVSINPYALFHAFDMRRGREADPTVQLMVKLRTGGVLVIEHRAPVLARQYMVRLTAGFAAVVLVLLLVLAGAVRGTVRPVRLLAESARRFSIDAAAADLPIRGPKEVRALSHAFNDMQARIRDLVAERTQLLAAIAHDLRTYLTRLRLRSDFIEDEAQRRKAVADIDEMSQLLADTLMFSREVLSDNADAAGFDLEAEARALVLRRQEIGQAVRIAPSLEAPGRSLSGCSRTAVRRMLDNLLDNALRYGRSATVTVAYEPDATSIHVDDDGPGIPQADIEAMTQPFVRLEPSRARETGGAGLGLAIVKGLAERCSGHLEIVNRAEGGLRASLVFPEGGDAQNG